jgi:hypothetical protein
LTGSAACHGFAATAGFNCSAESVAISRRGFPELVSAAKALPERTLLDGEIVVCDEPEGPTSLVCKAASTASLTLFASAPGRPG